MLAAEPRSWDALEFTDEIDSRRAGRAAWTLTADVPVFGFALWWECTLAPGVALTTSPFAPRTHWDQIYLPVLEPLAGRAGDEIAIEIASETGGDDTGIDVRWTVEQRRGGAVVARQALDLRAGFIG